MEEASELAHDFIQTFLNRMNEGQVAAFSLSYVGFDKEQKATFSGGNGDYELAQKLTEMLEESLAGVKATMKKERQ